MAVISVQARMGSTRLPGKVLLNLGQRRTLDWVCRRCEAAAVSSTWVTTSETASDDTITEWCRRNDVCYVRGPEDDLLARHLAVADETGADVVIRVNADCPFVPPAEIDRVWGVHRDNDAVYTTNQTGSAPKGINVDVIDVDTLRELQADGQMHPVLPLLESEANVALTAAPNWGGFETVELTLDTPEDYWRLDDAVEAVGGNPKDVVQYLNDTMGQRARKTQGEPE